MQLLAPCHTEHRGILMGSSKSTPVMPSLYGLVNCSLHLIIALGGVSFGVTCTTQSCFAVTYLLGTYLNRIIVRTHMDVMKRPVT
jgi:hypothetical protein